MPDDPKIIQSELTRTIEAEGTSVGVLIYRYLGKIEWTLEILDENGNTTIWDDKFATEEDALAEAIASIRTEGIWSFVHDGNEEDERATVH